MSYALLYEAVQTQGDRISTRWLKNEAIGLSNINKVKEQWSDVIEFKSIRGFYIEGPLGPPVSLSENEALIVLARSMCIGELGKHWRRFVFAKELMHVFDEPNEKADTPEKFDRQIEKMGDPSKDIGPQYMAELKAYWRALGAICREEKRLEYRQLLLAKEISPEVVATGLAIPVNVIHDLMRETFPAILQGVK
jgi:hypothetical protein